MSVHVIFYCIHDRAGTGQYQTALQSPATTASKHTLLSTIHMPTLVTMSDTSSTANKSAPTTETTMPTYTVAAGVAEDFAIWLRLDSKAGKNSTPDCLQDIDMIMA